MLAVLAALGACSEYTDRRDLISIEGGNAVQTNKVTHMADPWPRASANRDIGFNGNAMESAYERYRTGRVIAPNSGGTSATYQAPAANATPVGPTVTQTQTAK